MHYLNCFSTLLLSLIDLSVDALSQMTICLYFIWMALVTLSELVSLGDLGWWKPLNMRISWAPSKRQHREKYFLRSKYEWSNITIITSSVVFQSCKSRQQHNHVFPVIVHFIHCCCIIWLFCSTTRLVQSFWNWCRRNNSSGFSGPDTVFFVETAL